MISSHPEWSSYKDAPIDGNSFKRWLKSRFRFVDYPFILAYRGFGDRDKLYVQGHVFQGMALRNPDKRGSVWNNFIALIKMFLVQTVPEVRVQLSVKNQQFDTKTNENGFFQFEIKNPKLENGWHYVGLELMDTIVEGQEKVSVTSEVFINSSDDTIYISDIDDTFLVSHVTQKPLKLYTLLTKNAETRKPVKGSVDFYNALCANGNPFFYVSSSEWNLYDFLIQFIEYHKLPKGVLQLKNLKTGFLDFFKSGFGSHAHKLEKINRLIDLYNSNEFVLLGDNGQHDPQIYHEIAATHPEKIRAVYIRGVKRKHWSRTEESLNKIRKLGIEARQFRHSHEAFAHAQSIGLITE